jgi:DNA modification methylase
MTYYPISIAEVRAKVARKHRKSNTLGLEISSNVKKITNEYGETLTRVDGDIPVDLKIERGQRFLFISYEQSKYTHALHKYPAKFFPELPSWLIKKYSTENDIILDPFSGSATTNIEALLNKRHSVGIDVDPFALFLSKVKTTFLNPDDLKRSVENIITKIVRFDPSLVKENDIPVFPYRDNWFKKEIILELAYIRKSIDRLRTNDDIKDFFKVCFSSTIRAVSNADDNCTRTVVRKSLNKKVFPSMALTKFVESILINSLRIIDFSSECPRNTITEFPSGNDAMSIKYPDNYFGLAVTSPPYVNAVDYPRTHQLEMYWLGIAEGSLTPLKKMHIGTEAVNSSQYSKLHSIDVMEADIVLKKIFKTDPRRSYIAYKYLEDMRKNLQEVYRVLEKGGKYAIVVGNNKIRGHLFESWKYLMVIAIQTGFRVKTYFGSEIIKHFIKVPREERINTDWIIILEK